MRLTREETKIAKEIFEKIHFESFRREDEVSEWQMKEQAMESKYALSEYYRAVI